jgi:serine/threonine protein kinase
MTSRVLTAEVCLGGKYLLEKRIAIGGMGDVWVARDRETDERVALKILRTTKEERTRAHARFRHEAKLAGLLGHPGIVRVYDLIEEPDETLVLVMELLHGESLDHTIAARGPLPTREAVAIITRVLAALEDGHEHGIIHRDVKPANIFLANGHARTLVPKLLDFGIAKMIDTSKETTKGRLLGTPRYMSPEQIMAPSTIDARSDLFSAAVVLYELLTGLCPFDAPSLADVAEAVVTHEVDPDQRIEPKLWIEMRRALRKRPNERHASAGEMARAFCAAIGETEESLASALVRAAQS